MLTIQNTTFRNNRMGASDPSVEMEGGPVLRYRSSKNASASLDGCTFINNEGFNTSGGCFVLENVTDTTNFSVTNSLFINNSADVGGVLYSMVQRTDKILLSNNTYTNNTATLYGPVVASVKAQTVIVDVMMSTNRTRPPFLTLFSSSTILEVRVIQLDGFKQVAVSRLFDSKFGRLDITRNDELARNAQIFGETASIIVGSETTFFNLTVRAEAPPVSLQNASFEYNLTLYEIDLSGRRLATLDNLPIRIPACSADARKEYQTPVFPYPDCVPGTFIKTYSHGGAMNNNCTVTCKQNCAANQGDCTDVNVCSCKEGYEGLACELRYGRLSVNVLLHSSVIHSCFI
jgi:hypothetical protein